MARPKQSNLWPFDSFIKSTSYDPKKGTKSRYSPSKSYKGYSIRKTRDAYSEEEFYTIPKLDSESRFDTLTDAKNFINRWVKNPMRKKRKNSSEDWLACHAIKKNADGSISVLTEKGILTNPGKRRKFLAKIKKIFS